MTVGIRQARNDDVDDMYRLSCAVHLAPLYERLIPRHRRQEFLRRYTPNLEQRALYGARLRRRLADPDWFAWVARHTDGRLCGFTLARHQADKFMLRGLFIAPVFQGQGIGTRLLVTACEAAPAALPIVTDVIAKNEPAISFYRAAGFAVDGDAPSNFYGAARYRMARP